MRPFLRPFHGLHPLSSNQNELQPWLETLQYYHLRAVNIPVRSDAWIAQGRQIPKSGWCQKKQAGKRRGQFVRAAWEETITK